MAEATTEEPNDVFGTDGPVPFEERPGSGLRGQTHYLISGKLFVQDRIQVNREGITIIVLRCSMRRCHGRARIHTDGPRVAYFNESTRRHECTLYISPDNNEA